MQLHEECKDCLLKSQLKKIESAHADNPKAVKQFKKEVQALVKSAPQSSCAPLLMREINGLSRKIFGCDIDYSAEKTLFNGKLLALEEQLFNEITATDDPLCEALKFTMAANYIDFARLSDLNEGAVDYVLSAARRAEPQKEALEKLKEKLQTAKTLLFLHDNCGEIVLDKILIRVIKQIYPQISVTSVVRGAPIINDVTLKDAKEVNLSGFSTVIDNGTDIPGTYLKEINPQTLEALETSDVIISKGLGNLETLYGEGFEIFYSFTCKCGHIATRFNSPLWSAAFVYEEKSSPVLSDGAENSQVGFPAEEERSGADILVESLSPETHIHRMGKFIPKKTAAYIVAALYFAVGVLCVSITNTIAEVLPYIIGSAMALIAFIRLIIALATREFKSAKTNKTATSLVLIGFVALILYEQISGKHDDAIVLISVAWGIEGLFEGAHAFNHAFATMFKSWKCAYFFLKGIIECAVAFILLYLPSDHNAHFLHIVVFGANLIIDAITMLPPVKNFFKIKKEKK